MDKRIVFTRQNNGVSIMCPGDAFRYISGGGGFLTRIGTTIADEVWNDIRRGVDSDSALAWHTALECGGCTEAEAYGLLARKDVPAGSRSIELWAARAIPTDRWFRNAWRQGRRGIYVDMAQARELQAKRILFARTTALERCRMEIDEAILLGQRTNLPALLDEIENIDFTGLGARMRGAETPVALKAVWPDCLPRQQL